MPTHRALIVDDSRSARHILGRMLESFGLEVDAVESGELALTYLQQARPDVIFMDHLMPGMDGFAAVRVIKANPATATIPVLMYTSQEGELYLSQARALGAMGVLPKTLKHAQVAEALQQLNLHTQAAVPVPRAATTQHASTPALPAPERAAHSETSVAPIVEVQLEGAYPIQVSMPQLAHRIATEVHAELLRTNTDEINDRRWRNWALLTSVVALLLLSVVIYQQYQMQQQILQLQTKQAPPSGTPTSQPTIGPAIVAAATPAPTSLAQPGAPTALVETEEFAYGEIPLMGARLERLRSLIDSMRSDQVKGVLQVETFLGDFCLNGSPAMGYMPAADDVLVSRCDLVGNPFGDALTVQQRQSVAFANLVANINSNASSSGIRIQLVDGAHKALVPYPTLSASLTAATWNRIAERNQRVEFTVMAAP